MPLTGIEFLKAQLNTYSEKYNKCKEFFAELEKKNCCESVKKALEILNNKYFDVVERNFKIQGYMLSSFEHFDKKTYNYEDIQLLITSQEYLKAISSLLNYINFHILSSKTKKFNTCIHALQNLGNECENLFNKIFPQHNKTYFIICSGGIPSQISNFTEIFTITFPYYELQMPTSWPAIGHEYSHGFLNHKRYDDIEKLWRQEFEADFFGTILFGPSYFFSFL